MENQTLFKISVQAIIFNDSNSVLLCHRADQDSWTLPQGDLLVNEAPWQGIVRVVKSMTGADIKVEKLQGIYTVTSENKLVFSFVCKTLQGNMQANTAIDKFTYMQIFEFPQNMPVYQVERIKDSLLKPGELLMRIQQ